MVRDVAVEGDPVASVVREVSIRVRLDYNGSERSLVGVDDAHEGDVLPNVINLDRRLLTWLGLGNDDDVAPFDLRDPIALVANQRLYPPPPN